MAKAKTGYTIVVRVFVQGKCINPPTEEDNEITRGFIRSMCLRSLALMYDTRERRRLEALAVEPLPELPRGVFA